jgi:outer membrane protein OmpA-like peptidoglycan-associated protein
MNETTHRIISSMGAALLLAAAVSAQEEAMLKMSVEPKEAYTFVDGNAMGPGSRSFDLPLGAHTVVVANYGYKFFEREVSMDGSKPTVLKVSLEPSGPEVSGPFGRIQLELGPLSLGEAGDHAVLLNGKTANHFVGHVDEMNNDIVWHQELIVPAGNHIVTVTRGGQEVWSDTVTVAANQRVIIDISNGKRKTKDWAAGAQLKALPRFTAGIASARIVIAPVSGEITASPAKINCGQPSQLKWTSAETVDADISGFSPVPVTGDRTVSPKQTTAYEFTATGPGGVTKSSTTIDVNTVVQSSLAASPTEIQYRQIGDKTIQAGDATLNWSSTNADSASLTPFGTVEPNGNKSLAMKPTQTTTGPVDETIKFTLTATNACGGSETQVASVHLTGAIEPVPEVLSQSVFFPTDYPTTENPSVGLVRSQQEVLATLANRFTKYLEYDPEAQLSLAAYADVRGPNDHNQRLSERRVQRVKEFLVSQGVAEGKINTSAYGSEKQLDESVVTDSQCQNPNPPSESPARDSRSTLLAYNRRVDVALHPSNPDSLRICPNNAPDSGVLWQLAKPQMTVVEQNQ